MKVYLVTYTFWNDSSILGVYSTEQKAKEAVKLDAGIGCSVNNYRIDEMELQ